MGSVLVCRRAAELTSIARAHKVFERLGELPLSNEDVADGKNRA